MAVEYCIHEDYLLYYVVCATPGLAEMSELNKMVLAGLLLYVEKDGVIPETYDRARIMEGLNLSTSGLSNVIKRLIRSNTIIRREKGYQLTTPYQQLANVPKRLNRSFIVKFKCNEPALSAPGA